MRNDSRRKISTGRKVLYYSGMGMIAIGIILFLSTFVVAFTSDPFELIDSGKNPMKLGVYGFIMIFLGTVLRGIGALGTSGSGLILDPQEARNDLNPYTSAVGGMISDVLDEVKAVRKEGNVEEDREVVRIRCKGCKELNEEDAKFCKGCGAPL